MLHRLCSRTDRRSRHYLALSWILYHHWHISSLGLLFCWNDGRTLKQHTNPGSVAVERASRMMHPLSLSPPDRLPLGRQRSALEILVARREGSLGIALPH